MSYDSDLVMSYDSDLVMAYDSDLEKTYDSDLEKTYDSGLERTYDSEKKGEAGHGRDSSGRCFFKFVPISRLSPSKTLRGRG